MVSCIIFDLDGTLVDSEGLCNQAFLDLLPEINIPVCELVSRFKGLKLSVILGELELILGRKLPRSFEDQYRKRVAALFQTELVSFEGVPEALSKIELPMCVASSGPRVKIENALNHTGLSQFFKGRVFSSYEVGSWKPDPGLFLHVAQSMGVKPQDCLVIEDSEVGIEAAKSAKMSALQFCGVHSERAVQSTFDRFQNLPEIIQRFELG